MILHMNKNNNQGVFLELLVQLKIICTNYMHPYIFYRKPTVLQQLIKNCGKMHNDFCTNMKKCKYQGYYFLQPNRHDKSTLIWLGFLLCTIWKLHTWGLLLSILEIA